MNEKLYYYETSSTIQYTSTINGDPVISQLAEGKPYWVSLTPPKNKKKKSLVLADWTAPTWSEDKLKQVQKTLSDLIEDGFAIYSWQNGRVIPINKNHLLTMTFINYMTIASEQEVANAAIAQKENKLTKEQVLVIDNHSLNLLIKKSENSEPRILRTSEIPSDWSDQTLAQMITLLITSTPKIEKI